MQIQIPAAKVDAYNVGAASAPFAGNDLDHCIAEYYDAIAGYHDAVLATSTISRYHNNTIK